MLNKVCSVASLWDHRTASPVLACAFWTMNRWKVASQERIKALSVVFGWDHKLTIGGVSWKSTPKRAQSKCSNRVGYRCMRTHMMQYRILSQSQAIGENSLRSQTTSLHLSLKYLDSILPNVGLVERTWKNSNNEQRRKDDKNAKIASFGDDSNDYNVRCHDPHNNVLFRII